MTPRKIRVEEARAFWEHPSQHVEGSTPDALPQDGPLVQYWAVGPICGVFHPAPWPRVWMVHIGCKPEGWGQAVSAAKAGLGAFWNAESPDAIVGWTPASKRAAVAFARRCGFVEHGRLALPSGDLILQNWRP